MTSDNPPNRAKDAKEHIYMHIPSSGTFLTSDSGMGRFSRSGFELLIHHSHGGSDRGFLRGACRRWLGPSRTLRLAAPQVVLSGGGVRVKRERCKGCW